MKNLPEEFTEVVGGNIINSLEKNMSNLKRFAVSSGITFVAVFAVVFCTAVQETSFVFSKASLVSLAASGIIVAVRAVAKLIVEYATGFIGK